MGDAKLVFPSPEWVVAYRDKLNASAEYNDAASTWTHGAIAMVIRAAPDLGLKEPFCVWLDVERGRCNAARQVSFDEAQKAPFCLSATYPRWRDVLGKRLDPIAGMVTRKLELKGNLITMMRYVRSAKAMVKCATQVPSLFLDEKESSGGAAVG